MKGIIVILILLLSGCALFQKTTKQRSQEKQEKSKQTEMNRLAVKAGQTETNVYTYWPDGSVYQWQHSVGQVNEAKFGTLRVDEQATTKTEGTTTQRVPSSTSFIILLIAGILIVVFILYKS
jgi:PBP1b-binding outer membrane lipoprotein LpoB